MNLFQIILPWILLLFVLLAVIFRRIGKFEIPAWSAFLIAAIILIAVVPSGMENALNVLVNQADVFIFLFGMFVIVTALEISGVLQKGAKLLLNKAKNGRNVIIWIVFGFGLAAAILINDTVAIIAPLLLITFAKQIDRDAKPFVIIVALALTFGSALLPTGNPQNFILANVGNISFIEFFLWALGPTILGLLICFFYIRLVYRKEFTKEQYVSVPFIIDKHEHESLTIPSIVALGLILIGMIISSFVPVSKALIILIVAGLLLFIRNERNEILAKLDWGVLLFFAGMFIVIDAVSTSEMFLNTIVNPLLSYAKMDLKTYVVFVLLIFFSSQIFSNVPIAIMIANLIPGTILDHTIFWIAAALTSTFAGATTVLGAASNIIVLETVRKRGLDISWWEFTKKGLPISLLSLVGVFLLGIFYFPFFT
ncbi:MAG: SLC13 family permease [Candidatus Thorarchaeota archaeon]